jgi:PAS domain-containing protein
MGGKRGYADGLLDVLGRWPDRWLMVDADPAIVLFWCATFGGWLPLVAEAIRNAPADGEELWRLWTSEPVPADPVERLARWVVAQRGSFSGRPVSWSGERMKVSAGGGLSFKRESKSATGRWSHQVTVDIARDADSLAEWSGLAGYKAQRGFPGQKSGELNPASATSRALAEWSGLAGFKTLSANVKSEGTSYVMPEHISAGLAEWSGLAGYARVADSAKATYKERIVKSVTAGAVDAFALGARGAAMLLDLNASSVIVQPGDLWTIDPPYAKTTGYADELPRERVVELAEEAHDRGARVVVHEQEAILEGGPWRTLELPRTHGGGQRTWSKQQTEIIAINFEPATGDPGKPRGRKPNRAQTALPLFERS